MLNRKILLDKIRSPGTKDHLRACYRERVIGMKPHWEGSITGLPGVQGEKVSLTGIWYGAPGSPRSVGSSTASLVHGQGRRPVAAATAAV